MERVSSANSLHSIEWSAFRQQIASTQSNGARFVRTRLQPCRKAPPRFAASAAEVSEARVISHPPPPQGSTPGPVPASATHHQSQARRKSCQAPQPVRNSPNPRQRRRSTPKTVGTFIMSSLVSLKQRYRSSPASRPLCRPFLFTARERPVYACGMHQRGT